MHISNKRILAALLIVGLLALAGCGTAANSVNTTAAAAPTATATAVVVSAPTATPTFAPAGPDNQLHATTSYPSALDNGDDNTLTITLANVGKDPISGLNL